MSFHASGARTREYESHPVPRAARLHTHVAAFFHAHAGQPFVGKATGREIADELARNLRPSARRELFGEVM